jgi:hypothetical protein
MISDPRAGERVTCVVITDHSLTIDLLDARTIAVPLAWYPRLLHATDAQRSNFRIIGGGYVINWPDVDEHLSVHGILAGTRGPGVPPVSPAT